MKRTQNIDIRAVGLEILRALSVLAIVFLSFAHQPVNAQGGSSFYRLADGSVPVFCGGGPIGEKNTGSKKCEACHITAGIGLPSRVVDTGVRITAGLMSCVPFRQVQIVSYEYSDFFHSRAPPVVV